MLDELTMDQPFERMLYVTLIVWMFGSLWISKTAEANDFCKCMYNSRTSCDCAGNFTSFPSIPVQEVESLHLTHGRLRGINGTSLAHFGTYLTELSITHMYEFTFIDDQALINLPKLKYVRISYTSLLTMPELKGLGRTETLNTVCLDNNKIQDVQASGVRTVELLLSYNDIKNIEGWAFNGSEIHKLSLRGNKLLSQLSYHSFSGLKKLKELNAQTKGMLRRHCLTKRRKPVEKSRLVTRERDLSETLVSYLPPAGLHELETLKMTNTGALQPVPFIYDMERLRQAWMTYAIRCCEFSQPCAEMGEAEEEARVVSTVTYLTSPSTEKPTADSGALVSRDGTRYDEANVSSTDASFNAFEYQIHRRGTSYPSVSPMSQWDIHQMCNYISGRNPGDCWPQLELLSNCEDLITSMWVRGSVWVVLLIALIGNVLVLLIVTLSRSEKTVARFLTGNLAFADLCMAVYLFLLATMDAISSKTYYNYAYLWQQGVGCKIAGFLTIFSCQLSFFTLSLLTIERWFSIKRALYSNLLDTRMTTMIMTCGWFYSLLMATLPLIGISSYSSASICLPMDVHDYPSLVYILVLLGTGGVAFLLMCFCYTQIYMSLRQETRHPKGGRSVARKIFILVATNFFCWSPIAFFALAAVTGHPLISVTKSKVLLLFIYPINSCANPYLYVIMTKQFKKDLMMLLSRCGLCTLAAEQYRMNYSRPMSHDTYQTTVNSARSFVV